MAVLILDTCSNTFGVGVVTRERVLAEITGGMGRTHAAKLLPAVSLALEYCNMALVDMEAIAVTRGPGSFTGLRIGIATAKGLALAAQKPLVGISPLAALAANLPFCRRSVWAALDAKRGQVFAARYDTESGLPLALNQEMALTPEQWLEQIAGPAVFVGEGALRYRKLLLERLGEKALMAPAACCLIKAGAAAALAYDALDKGQAGTAQSLMPVYMRQADAKLPQKKAPGKPA
ncbi:MAG: tRNA (adenosine(37)-N6)-threonylcarbamoyltransferase complex dimerization subunit type 1 TsaB [Desulfatibacillaceae bacterium]|nr:tRNA (adenosine(37)-N6)-threonylcarbamoyltransferase complex dimerization subunit type 1 TsaB [Desulfatibacillaceae bacterium]